MLTLPMHPIAHLGVTELVGKNEQVDQNELGAAVEADLPGVNPVSGEFLAFTFYATEEGTGSIQDSAGELLIFTADPGHSVGDDGSGISAAEWQTLIGTVSVAATDWIVEDAGAVAHIKDQPVPFHGLTSLFFVWRHTDATSLNDGAGDDEVLDFDAWYLRYS